MLSCRQSMTVSLDRRFPMYEFTCRYTYNSGKKSHWKVCWDILEECPENHELLILGRGSQYRVVLGSCTTGLYMCIPTINIGCALAHAADIQWNTAQISKVLNETDAASIATAIYYYGWIG